MLDKLSCRHLGRTALIALVLLLAVAQLIAARALAADSRSSRSAGSATVNTPAYMPHEVIVGYARGPVSAVTSAFENRMGLRASSAPTPDSRLLRLPRGETVPAAIARLRRQPGVAYVQPDYIARTADTWFPNDRGRPGRPGGWQSAQWNFLDGAGVNAPQAWANLRRIRKPGGRGVVVAILDTGVAYRDWQQFHRSPDFKGTRFVHPYDFVAKNRYPLDRNGHGTFVAGIVAEATNNRFGLTGLAYGASIMPVRILNGGGLGDEATIASGIRYAVNHGATVINLSLEFLPSQVTSGGEIPAIVGALNYAHRRGVTVVGAAGNDESNVIAYPARVPGVISVGATTRDRCLAGYSNGGTGLDLVAPGGGADAIMPSDPDCHPYRSLPSIYQLTLTAPPHWARFGYPGRYFGTSMASPEVAATVALVVASRVIGRHPTPDEILARLEQTATPLGGTQPNPSYGFGLLNAGAATDPQAVPALP